MAIGKKENAEALKGQGRNLIGVSKRKFSLDSNKEKLKASKEGARRLVQGTIDANRAKREAQSTDSNN
jgi:hypothetical protein